jgi:catechol 2,3-dioxygenase-like lactoylglutathione lyase family enzyme
MPGLGRAIPVLRIFDLAKAREFYVDWLRFAIDWEGRPFPDAPVYLQVSRGDCVLHLSEHYGDGTPGSGVLVETQGIDALCAELQGYKYYRPHVEDQPWGARTMTVLDPFGNRITFSEARR